jgi:hypothetical protein
MARPTDPAKLAAYLARQARNSANYRARQRAATIGTPAPAEAVKQRAANYRPPRVSGIVENAQASAQRQRIARASTIGQLPDVRNPQVRLRPGEVTDRMAPDRKTRAGKQRQAAAIRERAAAERLQAIGRARRHQLVNELQYGAQSDRLQDAMTRDQQREFQQYSEVIATGSQQSLAILFEYAGGQNQYSAAIERILASPESRDVEEGLAMLAALAEQARAAADLYSPSRIGRLTV